MFIMFVSVYICQNPMNRLMITEMQIESMLQLRGADFRKIFFQNSYFKVFKILEIMIS